MTKSEPNGGGGGGVVRGGGGRHISPAEWISDYFSPVVSVLSRDVIQIDMYFQLISDMI